MAQPCGCPVGKKNPQSRQGTDKLESFGSSHFVYSLVIIIIIIIIMVIIIISPMGIAWYKLQSAVI